MKNDTSKSTMLVISMAFLVFYLIYSWRWAIFLSLAVGVIGILSSYLSKKIEWIWMKLSKMLGFIIPNIILSAVYFIILFPISLLYKLFNKDTLMLSGKYDTFFIDVQKEIDIDSFKKIW
jgi:hypothetical protein